MDSLKLLRDARPDQLAPTSEAMTQARAHLMNAIEAEKAGAAPAAQRRGPGWFARLNRGTRWGLVGGTAAVAAGALALTQVLVPSNSPIAPTSAVAAELNALAQRASATDASLLPGQYREVSMTTWQTAWVGYGEHGASYPITNRSRDALYIPRESSQAWFYRSGPSDRYKTYSAAGARQLRQLYPDVTSGDSSWKGHLYRGTAGTFTRPVDPIISVVFPLSVTERIGADPETTLRQLREWARAQLGTDPESTDGDGTDGSEAVESGTPDEVTSQVFDDTVDSQVFAGIRSMLVSGTLTPTQQGTLFGTLAIMPTDRVTLTKSTDGSSARTTFTWAGVQDQGTRSSITLDDASGLATLIEDTLVKGTDGAPAGTVISSTELRSRVLDSAPSGSVAADLPMPKCTDPSSKIPPKGYGVCGDPEQDGSRAWAGE